MVYLLDSNFFIQAHKSTYPLDIAVSFWSKVKQLAYEGKIIGLDKVKDEIYTKATPPDELETWCRNNLPDNFFKDSSEVMNSYIKVVRWAQSRSNHYLPGAINEFLNADEADAFLVAYGLSNPSQITIVTQEVSEPYRKNKIKIPEACNALTIKCVNSMEMFRILGVQF